MRPWTVRARLTFYYAFALALTTLLLSAGVYVFVRADMTRQMRYELALDFKSVAKEARAEPEEVREIVQQGNVALFEIRGHGQPLAATPGWRQAGLAGAWNIHQGPVPIAYETHRHGLYYVKRGVVATQTGPMDVMVARDGGPMRRMLASLAAILLVGFACALGLALVGGYLMAGRALAPIGIMAAKARAITADSLSQRLPVYSPDDELGQLATAFNSTLARLEDSFLRLRSFTSDASHELRTPLAAMKSVGEVALRDGSDSNAHREGIGSMLEEVDRLTRLVESLLTLTRGDSSAATLCPAPTKLSDLVEGVVDCMRVLADERAIAISIDANPAARALVDAATLKQAIVNVLDNAIKYTPAGGSISIAVIESNGQSIIEVTDTGPGIPAADRGHVFDRFYRGDKSRSSDTGGVGLGLAIAKWAVRANGGSIELADREGAGCTFRIAVPSERGGGNRSS